MTQEPAMRLQDDSEYGNTGYWYYHWPALRCVFRTDYEGMKFNPDDHTEELTFDEFIALSLHYNEGKRLPAVAEKGGYYINVLGDLFETDEPVDPSCAIRLTPAEYLAQ